MKKTLALIVVLLSTLLLAACGSDDSGDETATGGDAGVVAQFNDADVTFAQGMIPHHEQAVEMAQQAEDRAESAEVMDLAAQIEAAQAPEIEQLTTWLEQWGAETPPEELAHEDMGHGDADSDMSGMMTAADMSALRAASGAEFDRMFLQMMIEHHRGALTMAETEVAEGDNPDAIAMAQEIITTQNAEIEQMETLLSP